MLAFQMASYVPSVRMHFAMSSFVVHPPGTFSRYIIKPLGCRSRAMFRELCRSVYLTCAFQVLFLLHSSSLSLFNKYCNYSAGVPRSLQGPLAGCGGSPPFSPTPPPPDSAGEFDSDGKQRHSPDKRKPCPYHP